MVFNYGTTFKGGCDDVQTAGERLVKVLKKNNMYERTLVNPDNPSSLIVRRGFWFRVDGALAAAYMPFLIDSGSVQIKEVSIFGVRRDCQLIPVLIPTQTHTLIPYSLIPVSVTVSCSVHGYWLGVLD